MRKQLLHVAVLATVFVIVALVAGVALVRMG